MLFLLLRYKKFIDFILNILVYISLSLKLNTLLFNIIKFIKKMIKSFLKLYFLFFSIIYVCFNKGFLIVKKMILYVYKKIFKTTVISCKFKNYNYFNNLFLLENKIKKIIIYFSSFWNLPNLNYQFITEEHNLNLITDNFLNKLIISLLYFSIYIYFSNIIFYNIAEISEELSYKNLEFFLKFIPAFTIYTPSIFSLFFTYWLLIQIFILRDYLKMPIILKYNILVTLIVFLIFYGFVHTIEAFFENEEYILMKYNIIANKLILPNIRLILYGFIYLFFINSLFYFYTKSITVKENEHVYANKNFLNDISKSFYFWIRYGLRAKKGKKKKIKLH